MKDTCKNSFQFPATILILILIVGCSVKVADFFGISILHSTSTDASLRTENYIFEETEQNILSLPALPAGAAGEKRPGAGQSPDLPKYQGGKAPGDGSVRHRG